MAAAAAVLWLSAVVAGAVPPPTAGWQDAPQYVPLFAPSGPRAAAYHAYVSPLAMDVLIARLASEPSLLHPPGSWTPTAVIAADAFGQTGGYDRSRLARLYGSKRAIVARGPRGAAAHPTEVWTLISPYPSADLTRLEPGTLLIVLNLEFP
jgi:hypothetical protein